MTASTEISQYHNSKLRAVQSNKTKACNTYININLLLNAVGQLCLFQWQIANERMHTNYIYVIMTK